MDFSFTRDHVQNYATYLWFLTSHISHKPSRHTRPAVLSDFMNVNAKSRFVQNKKLSVWI